MRFHVWQNWQRNVAFVVFAVVVMPQNTAISIQGHEAGISP
jgi:hypothetical protein